MRVYDALERILDIRSFYLFVCLESDSNNGGRVILTALALVDGNLLNADFEFYLGIVGEREKQIGLGSYGDGADRNRPMLIFSNPLGAQELDYNASLLHSASNVENEVPDLRTVYEIERTLSSGRTTKFYCYQLRSDVPNSWEVSNLKDPFPTPTRDSRTRPRGKFKLPFQI